MVFRRIGYHRAGIICRSHGRRASIAFSCRLLTRLLLNPDLFWYDMLSLDSSTHSSTCASNAPGPGPAQARIDYFSHSCHIRCWAGYGEQLYMCSCCVLEAREECIVIHCFFPNKDKFLPMAMALSQDAVGRDGDPQVQEYRPEQFRAARHAGHG